MSWLAEPVIAVDEDDDELYGIDFTDRLPSGVTISSVAIEQANDGAQEDLTITPTINAASYYYSIGQRAYTAAIGTFVSFGITTAPAANYRIKFKAACSDGKVRSVTCRLNVVDGLTQA